MLANAAATAVLGLAFLSGVAADISILFPNAASTWFRNDTVFLNWTTAGPTDPKEFRVFLNNPSLMTSGAQQLADQVSTANDFVRLSLGQITDGDGYIVSLVNTTNTTQVFAKSEAFKIATGAPATTTHATGVATTTGPGSSAVLPPGVTTASGTSNPFATANPKSGAQSNAAPIAAAAVLAVVGAALAL